MSLPTKYTTLISEKIPATFEAGKNHFWNGFLQNGNRTDYNHAFGGCGWTVETFKPNHNMNISKAYFMFRESRINGDLTEILKQLNVELKFVNCERFEYAFYDTPFTHLGVIDMSGAKSCTGCFAYCATKKIDKLIVHEGLSYGTDAMRMNHLEDIEIEGIIGGNGFNVQWATKLKKASIISIINALSTTTTGLSITLSKTAVNNAFTDEEWATLIATKSNWTISLA